ncbi:MAG: protein kinase [Planctomycetia bacterium]|nr:protein kinase [Planctomycetia bacterium]
MQTNPQTCNPDALDSLLADRLDNEGRVALEQHLESCTACRDQLERLAAAPEVWTEAHDSLSTAADDADRSAPALSSQGEADGVRAEHILGFLSPTDDPRMLGRFGGYEVAGVIGCGGMGIVLKGLDVALNRYVAIKVLAPHLATSAAARLRFAREARAAAAVVHENVLAIHAVSEVNGLPYLVMPYIRGTSLQKRLDANGPFTATEVLRVGRQVAAGLASAHAQGLVHRDIKPANILLENGVERLKITDFGLARAADDASLTRSGVIAGTPQFMSPEQARDDAIDTRSDLFSLGSVLYALCTGHPPFRAETSFGMLRRISDDVPRPIRDLNTEIPDWLAGAIERLHAKRPADRFQSAEEVARLFEQCLAHLQQPQSVALPAALRRAPAGTRRGPGLPRRLTEVAAACVLIALFAVAIWQRPQEKDHTTNPASSLAGDGKSPVATFSTAVVWDDGTDGLIAETQEDVNSLADSTENDWPR